jgi:hypothetical protein
MSASSPLRAAVALAASLVAGCASTPLERPDEGAPTPRKQAVLPSGGRSVEDVLTTIGPRAEPRLRARFAKAGVAYPPRRVHLLAFKQERRLELWASAGGGRRHVASYPLTADSGELGPKLREGDYQIPEGIYRVAWLNPNSAYHLSLKLDYPNEFDRARAREDGRTRLGGDIFIHGGDASIGCLAVGDPAIEELFVLAARVGAERVTAVIAPWDLRRRDPPSVDREEIPWLPDLYSRLSRVLASFRRS